MLKSKLRSAAAVTAALATVATGAALQLRDDGKLLLIHGRTVVKVLH